jgi:tetratricopeptide (TPR) repeat protein
MVQVSKRLVVRKEVMVDNTQELITSLDVAMADYYCSNKDFIKGLSLYRDLIPNLSEPEKQASINRFIGYSLQYGQTLMQEKKWAEAVEIYRDIMKNSGYPVNVYKNIGLCMKSMGNADLAIKFLKRFEELSPDKEDVYVYLADITYSDIKDNLKAIEYYEKALIKNNKNYSIYNMLGHLYSTCHQDKFKDKLQVIGVSVDEISLEQANEFKELLNINYPIAYTKANEYLISSLGGVVGIPFSILYYPNGKLATSYSGLVPIEMLENDIKKVIK